MLISWVPSLPRLVTESAFVPRENCLRQLCPLFSLPIMLEFIPALMRTLWLLLRLFAIPLSNIPSAILEVKRSQLVPRPLTQPNYSFNLYFLISWACVFQMWFCCEIWGPFILLVFILVPCLNLQWWMDSEAPRYPIIIIFRALRMVTRVILCVNPSDASLFISRRH